MTVLPSWMVGHSLDSCIFYPGFKLPDCVEKHSGSLLIIGTARCVLDDLDTYQPPGEVMVLKQMGMFYPRFRHWWVSDTVDWALWHNLESKGQRARDMKVPYKMHANTSLQDRRIDYHWQFNPRVGRSAGTEAAIAAIAMGYDEVVLAGCPGDGTGHFFPDQRYIPDREPLDYGALEHETAWRLLSEKVFQGRVRSLSGSTKDWLAHK